MTFNGKFHSRVCTISFHFFKFCFLETGMSLISYEENSQWHLLEAPLKHTTRVGQKETVREYLVVEYILKLKRKSDFYTYTLILPNFLLTRTCLSKIFLAVSPVVYKTSENSFLGLKSFIKRMNEQPVGLGWLWFHFWKWSSISHAQIFLNMTWAFLRPFKWTWTCIHQWFPLSFPEIV